MNPSFYELALTKAKLTELVAWDKQLPDYVFTQRGYPFCYFFESSVTGRRKLLEEIIKVVSTGYNSNACISIAHDARNGDYDLDQISMTTLIIKSEDDSLLNYDKSRFFEYIAGHPYTGITCGTNETQDWILYDQPAEMVGVIVSKFSIDKLVSNSDYIFSLERFLNFASSPGMGLSYEFLKSIEDHYAPA